MTKRILAGLLAIACLLTGVALAETTYHGDMKVIKVKQAVNMRKGPSTDTASVGKVPVDTVLSGCTQEEGSDWIKVQYEGKDGYIRSDFLEKVEAVIANEFTILSAEIKGLNIQADRQYEGNYEVQTVYCLDGNENEMWRYTTRAEVTELTQTDCFIGGTQDMPIVYLYNAVEGLYAVEPASGEVQWKLPRSQAELGASVSHAVADDGTLYMGGYYGPDPVAIDIDGNVLWQSDVGDDTITWLYAMELTADALVCQYGSMRGDDAGQVTYSLEDGSVLEATQDLEMRTEKPEAKVLSAETDETVKDGDELTFTVKTSADAWWLMMYDEKGNEVGRWMATDDNSAIDGDARVWTVKRTIRGAGERTLTFRAGVGDLPSESSTSVVFVAEAVEAPAEAEPTLVIGEPAAVEETEEAEETEAQG